MLRSTPRARSGYELHCCGTAMSPTDDTAAWRSEAMRILDRSLSRLPGPLRTLVDWALTITLAIVAILVFQAEVATSALPTSGTGRQPASTTRG